MTGETVIGVFARDRLNPALAAMHRAGFGAHARVLDGSRGDLAAQWRRANLTVDLAQLGLEGDDVVVLINAPGRSTAAASTLARVGARAVWRHDRATLTRHEGGPNAAPALAEAHLPRLISETLPAVRSPILQSEDIGTSHTESAGSG